MNIETRILADSINPKGVRLTSFLFTYPRIVHAEVMTHRVFSRNASSSRAIPIARMIERVYGNPAMPEYWGANRPGMAADQELSESRISWAKSLWVAGAKTACITSDQLAQLGVHKQLANRPMEPFSHIQVVVTSRFWKNFFGRRAHEKAQPEFMVLAYRALHRYIHSTPKLVPWGDWHLPFDGFGDPTYDSIRGDELGQAKVVSVRCARTSYFNFDGKCDLTKDMELYDQLVSDGHPSPFEHAAKADEKAKLSNFGLDSGWQQFRKMLPREDGEDEDLEKIYAGRPDWITLED